MISLTTKYNKLWSYILIHHTVSEYKWESEWDLRSAANEKI